MDQKYMKSATNLNRSSNKNNANIIANEMTPTNTINTPILHLQANLNPISHIPHKQTLIQQLRISLLYQLSVSTVR